MAVTEVRALHDALRADPESLHWRCADERASGAEVLDIARPGLRLESVEGAPWVPRAAFHDWIFGCAERLLKAYHGFGYVEDHEGEWLAHAVAAIKTTAEPPGEDAGVMKVSMYSLLASLNTFAAIRGGRPAEMGPAYEWVRDALSWACKRHIGDRRCRLEPPSLAARAADIHAQVAEHRARDGAAAHAAERRAQLDDLLARWRELTE